MYNSLFLFLVQAYTDYLESKVLSGSGCFPPLVHRTISETPTPALPKDNGWKHSKKNTSARKTSKLPLSPPKTLVSARDICLEVENSLKVSDIEDTGMEECSSITSAPVNDKNCVFASVSGKKCDIW